MQGRRFTFGSLVAAILLLVVFATNYLLKKVEPVVDKAVEAEFARTGGLASIAQQNSHLWIVGDPTGTPHDVSNESMCDNVLVVIGLWIFPGNKNTSPGSLQKGCLTL